MTFAARTISASRHTQFSLAVVFFLSAALAPATLQAQTGHPATVVTSLPSGLLFPVHLDHPVQAGKTPIGTVITASTTQRIPLTSQTYLKAGTRLTGTIVTSTPPRSGGPAVLTLRFTSLLVSPQPIPITATALAIANFTAVSDTSGPISGSVDMTNPSGANWTTAQIGGQEIARNAWVGPLFNESGNVGTADFNGVYALPTSPGQPPHALGVFSTTAAGLYGYQPTATLTATPGTFTITSPGRLNLYRLDNLLLQLDTPATPTR